MSYLRHKLQNGDEVEIITSEAQTPRKDWLEFTVTSRARSKIRAMIKKQQSQKSYEIGEKILDKEFRRQGHSFSKLLKKGTLTPFLSHYGAANEEDLIIKVGYGKFEAPDVAKTLLKLCGLESSAAEEVKEDDLVSMGVTFVSDDAPKQEKNIFSKDSSFKDKEQEQISPISKKVETKIPEPSKTQQIKEEKPTNTPPVDTKDLEADFSKTFNTPVTAGHDLPDGEDPIALEEQKLKRLHKELKDKAGSKKVVVKERLEKLRKEKESLGKELEEIKELELIASKIEEKLKNLEAIDSEIDSLEEQAHKELVS